MARRLGRQIGDRCDNFSRQSFFLLAMATKTVAAWSAETTNCFDNNNNYYQNNPSVKSFFFELVLQGMLFIATVALLIGDVEYLSSPEVPPCKEIL